MLIHDIKKAFNFTYLHVTSRTAPKQDRDDRKRSLKKMRKTNDSSAFIRNLRQKRGKKSESRIKRRRNIKDTAGDKLKLLLGCENHLHFKTKT